MSEETKVTTNTSTGQTLIGTGTMMPNTFSVGQPVIKQDNAVDYEKLASILDGRMKATEESVIKGYFKEQGLSGDEMAQAIQMFKADKASKQPNLEELNSQIEAANQRALEAELQLKANNIAVELGVPSNKLPYLLKMANTDKATKDGKVDNAKLKEALEAVLNDVPELKSVSEQNNNNNNLGSYKIGASQSNEIENSDTLNAQLAQAFGVKVK